MYAKITCTEQQRNMWKQIYIFSKLGINIMLRSMLLQWLIEQRVVNAKIVWVAVDCSIEQLSTVSDAHGLW